MPLVSRFLSGDSRLEACLTQDSAHLTPGIKGDFVGKVQAALEYVDRARIDEAELNSMTYGPSTADAVLTFKTKRQIINRSYQQNADNIVGKMTIERLDKEVAAREGKPTVMAKDTICLREPFGNVDYA